jgi:hypothetical protein
LPWYRIFDFSIRSKSIRLPKPIPSASASEHRLVDLLVDAWQVTDVLHLMDRLPWAGYLHAARGRFLPLSQASAQLAGSQSTVTSELLLINGSRISAIYAGPA